jgi:DNA-binding NtrC family response regulator
MTEYAAELRRAALQARSLMVTLDEDIRLAATVDLPVLITAEHRDRRDLCARVIHATGESAQGPFVTVTLGENRSSPHSRSKDPAEEAMLRQRFEHARGGTLFVDDVASATPDAQRQLLLLLEEGTLANSSRAGTRVGVRIIAGASRHLDAQRAAGEFDEPLFYRLNVIHLDLTSPTSRFL